MIPKRRRRPKLNCNSAPQIRNASHLKWIRGFDCSIVGNRCVGRIEAAHIRTGTDGSMAVKPSDCWAIPLCWLHHGDQHRMGERAFEARHGINMKSIAEQLWKMSPHRLKVKP